MDETSATRRDFLRGAGAACGAAWLGAHWPALARAAAHAHEAAAGRVDHEFRVLKAAQARDVAAIAAQIVPGGAMPGATEAGVVYFIDHVHAGLFAPRAPAFLQGLDAFQAEFARRNPGMARFADLDGPAQLEYLRSIEKTPFFGGMRFLTVLGLLSLPAYGGNERKLGWQLVGFVDQHAWTPPFGHYDLGYPGFTMPLPGEPS